MPVLKELQRRHDAEEYGGAPLLGVDGIAVICHGNARARAIANAFRAAAACARTQVNRLIVEAVAQIGEPAA
jgi:glycerol-3-phosphate acyltransferase PlsX